MFFFTGKRGGFSHLVPIIKILDKQKSINYKILVTICIYQVFLKDLNEIKKYSKKIILLDSIQIKDTIANRLQVISKTIQALSKIFKKKPNFYFYWVIGPRFLVLQLQPHYNIPIIHLYGGFNTRRNR